MDVCRLVGFNEQLCAKEVVGLRFLYSGTPIDYNLEKLVIKGLFKKGVPYDIDIDRAKDNGLIHALMCHPVKTIEVTDTFKSGERLRSDPQLVKFIVNKLLNIDTTVLSQAPKEFKEWVGLMLLDKEFIITRNDMREQVRLYKIACDAMGSNRAKSVKNVKGDGYKLKVFTYNQLYALCPKYKTERGADLSGPTVYAMLYYLAKARGYSVLRAQKLSKDMFAMYESNVGLLLNGLKDEGLMVLLAMLYV